MLRQRLITAAILAVAFGFLLMLMSPQLFSYFMIFSLLIAGWEWTDLARINSKLGKIGFLCALFFALVSACYMLEIQDVFNQQLAYQVSASIIVLWAIIFLWIQGYPSSALLWGSKPIMILLGLTLLVSTWVALAAIFHLDNGRWLLLLAIAIVVLADVGGYIAGNIFGHHKLAPVISPGKTWEGMFGGLVLQLLLISILKMLLPNINVYHLALLVIPVALCSVIGDLFESMLKRYRGIKDSSSLLPGHGGVLDRLDGIMPALPMFLVILTKTNPF